MHLEYSVPGIWYMTHLQAPGLDVSGVALPGTPGVIVGHNQRIAWGITNLQFDIQDLYIEKFDERSGRYLYQGHVEQAHLERELIRVKGQPASEMPIWVTRHGPLFVTDAGDRMALRWAVAQPGVVQFPLLEIDRAQNWEQFTTALARFPAPARTLSRRCGWQYRIPRRRQTAQAPRIHRDLRWMARRAMPIGMGSFLLDQLPSVYNPPGGIIVTANQNPFPLDYPNP